MKGASAILVATLVALLATAVPLGSLQTPYSAYNDDQTGTSHLLPPPGPELAFLHGPLKGLDPARDGVLIIAPRLPYEEAEAAHLRGFLQAGGRAVIADDAGSGRQLVQRLDVGVDIPEARIFSTEYLRSPRFPLLTSTGAVPGMPPQAVMERPHAVLGAGEPVLQSHGMTWLDTNNNGAPDLGEPRGAFATARLVRVGAGELLVVGDPDLFAGALASEGGAGEAFVTWLGAGRTLVVDEGHRATSDPLGLSRALSGAASERVLAMGLAAAAFGVAWAVGLRFRRVRVRRRRRLVRDPVLQAALQELPP